MLRRITIIILISLIAWPVCVLARMREDTSIELKGPRGGGKTVAAVRQGQENSKNEVFFKNAMDARNGDIVSISYYESGALSSVTYTNGTRVTYSYNIDDNDKNMNAITLTSGGVNVTFAYDATGKDGVGPTVVITSDSRDEGDFAKPVIVLRMPDGPTAEKIAHNPFPAEIFPKIKRALEELSRVKDGAIDEYKINSKPYYDVMEKALAENKDKLESTGVSVDVFLKDLAKANIPEETKRDLIDEAVVYIYTEAAKDKTAEAAEEFIKYETDARTNILNPAMEIYEGKIQSAMAYIQMIIDELLQSGLELYMNADKDKIEAIINLPEKSSNPKK